MKERIQSLISILEHDASNEEAVHSLEEAVTSDEALENVSAVIEELEVSWKRLVSAGRFGTACRVMDIELVLVEDPESEARLLRECARILDEELFDQRAALEKLKQLVVVAPEDTESIGKIESMESERGNWSEIVEKFEEQAKEATEPSLKAHMFFSAAERTYKNHKRGKEIPVFLQEALEADASHHRAARLLELVLTERERWEDLASLYVKLGQERSTKQERIQMLLAAGYTYGHRMEDVDSAAECYSNVLDLAPQDKSALKFLVKYFEEKEDWDHLVALYSDSLRGQQSDDEKIAMLMQAGMVHWRMRENMEDAEDYFRRLRKLEPSHQGMLGFYRKFYGEDDANKSKLLKILTDAQRATEDNNLGEKLNVEIAQLAGSEGGNVEKAIDAWKNVLRQEPDNDEARDKLKLLYRQSGKWNNLLDQLKAEVDGISDDDVRARVAVYLEMVEIYQDQLSLEMMVIKTYDLILKIDPDNGEALENLMAAYESAGRWNDLINILGKRAAVAQETQEKIDLLNRIANLWVERFNNFNKAIAPLEEIRTLDPTDRKAIETLKNVYQKRRAWKPLLGLLTDESELFEGEEKRDLLIEMAQLAGDRLSNHDRAIQIWKEVLALDPDAPDALPTLEKLTERQKDWEGLSGVIEIRVERAQTDEEKIALLTKLGTVLKDRVKDPTKAADAWSRLLEVQPGNAKAMRSLKDAYQAANDWEALEKLFSKADDYEGLVEVLGIAADRSDDSEIKMLLSFRCAEIYDDPIGQPDRAVRHYERVLSVDPDNLRAAKALVPIYRRAEKWSRLMGCLEVVLDGTQDKEERVLRIDELRELSVNQLNNRALAFKWAARAFEEMPLEESVREALEESAEAAGGFEELVEIYKKSLGAFEGERRVMIERRIAQIFIERLGAVDEAVVGYQAILEETPGDNAALTALDNIFRTTGRWDDLVGIFERRIDLCENDEQRREQIIEMAQLYEEGMDKPVAAAAHYRTVLQMFPEDTEALVSLERIFRLTEQWDELIEILAKRRETAEIGSDDWTEISFQVARLAGEELNDEVRAIGTYKELLDTNPGDTDSIAGLEVYMRGENYRVEVAGFLKPHLELSEDWRRLAWVLSILIEASDSSEKKLDLNSELANVYAERMDDKQLAFETLGAALRENPSDTDLWDRMTALSDELGLAPDLATRLAEAFNSESMDEENGLELARRLAVLYGEQLGQPADAEPYHMKVLAQDPGATNSFTALEELFTLAERWDDLLKIYRDALENGSGPSSRLDLLFKICFIVDEVNRDVPQAIDAYRAVLEEDPPNSEAVRALTGLYEEGERWEDLSALLRGQHQVAEGPAAIQLLYRIGEIAEHHLRNTEDAIECYEQVINDDPDHLKVQEALERLLDKEDLRQKAASILVKNYDYQGAAEPLARVLMIALEDDDIDFSQKVDILTRVADLRERRLGDPDGAFKALSSAFEIDPSRELVASEVARVATENGMELEYCRLLDEIIPKVTDDDILTSRLMGEVAKLYDERLGDIDRAQVAYRKLLEHDPSNPDTALPAVNALDRILTGKEEWEDLLDVLRIKVGLIGDPSEQRDVLHRMAEIEESVLERTDRAIALFSEIQDIDDTDMSSLSGLERLYEREGKWLELIEVLQKRAIIEESGDMRKEIYLRIARLFEESLEDTEEAIAAYNQACDETGPDREALIALARLFENAQRWSDLLDVYEAQEQLITDPDERTQMLYKMGDLLGSKLNEPERAVEKLGEALREDPSHKDARSSLEAMLDGPVKLEVIEILKPICEAEGDYERLLKFAEIQAKEADDPLERSRVLRESAEVAEVGLDDMERAFNLLGRAFRDGTASPDLQALIDNLERLAAGVDGFDRLVDLYREVGPDILDGDLQIRCNLRAAEIAHTMLEDLDVAREYYVKVLDMDGENVQAMNALEQIYQSQEQYLELFEIYRKKVQTADDDEIRREILFKQARVCEVNLEDLSGATQTYETILESDDENSDAMEALERLYPKAERWADLIDMLDRQVELGTGNPVELLHRLGQLAHDKLGDEERAFEYYAGALELDPNHQVTIDSLEAAMEDEAHRGRVAEILEPVYKQQGDWAKMAEALDARLQYCDDPMERKELLRTIGTVYEEQLGNLEKAFETFARLFQEDVEERSSWELLNRLSSVLENWERLAEVFSAALEDVVGDTPDTAELAFMLGEVYESRLDLPEDAKASYLRVLAFSPDDPKAFSAVERMLLATESWPDLLELYRDAADAALDTDQRKEFFFKIADIQQNSNNDLDAAINAYRDVMQLDGQDKRATTALDQLLFQKERFDDLTVHLRAQVDQAVEASDRNELRRRLARVFEENLDDMISAVDVYEEAISEEDGDPQSIAELERLILNEEQRQRIAEVLEPIYRETDQWKKLIVILKTREEVEDAPARKVSIFKEIAKLHEERGQNFLLAFNAYAKAFSSEPGDRETLSEMMRLAEGIDNWEDLATTLDSNLEEIYDMDFKVGVLHILGSTYDQRLDMPRKAIDAYRAVIEVDETDAEALDALEGLFNLVGDWEGLVEILSRKASLAQAPEDRAEILRTKASIYEDLMGSPKDAVDSYRQALEADATSIVVMDALERLYEASGEWIDLIDVRRGRCDAVTDPEERINILRSLGPIYEDKLEETFEAITSWRAVLEEDSMDAQAVAALDRLYTKESMHTELLDNLILQKEIVKDQAMWVDVGVRIGELQEKELSDLEGAIDSYRDVLAQQPTHAGAIAALERLAADESVRARAIDVLEPLHREASRNDSLARILELKLEVMEDPAERFTQLLTLAELHEIGLSDPEAAFDVYARALSEDSSRVEVMEALERIAGAGQLWKKLAGVYEERAQDAFDAEVERSILKRLGEIMEVHLGDARGAIEAYRRILDGGGTDKAVISALDRLYEREQMWTELDEVIEQELQLYSDTADINRLKIRQGVIREREFGDFAGAINAYRDVLEASYENDEAISAIEVLLEKDDFVEDVVEILGPVYEMREERHKIGPLFDARLRVAEDGADRVRLLGELAVHNEEVLGDPGAAFDAYARAFAVAPDEESLLHELERLADDLGSWSALVTAAQKALDGDRLDPSAQVELGLKIADWASTKVGDPRMAEARYRAVLEREPEHQGAIDALVELLRGLGRFEDLLPALKVKAQITYDFAAKKDVLFQAAKIAQFELGDVDRAIGIFKEVLDLDEADIDALDALIALTEDAGDYKSMVELLLARGHNTVDPTEANGFRHQAATLFLGPLETPAKAVDVLRDVLDMDSTDEVAISQLDLLYQKLERWKDLQDLYMQKLDNATDERARVEVLRSLAMLAEQRFDDPDEATGHLQEVLMIDPQDDQANADLERIYSKTERWQDLVEMLEGRADRARDQGNVESELTLLVRIGEIWDGQLSDPDRATDIYERVLEQDPEHTRALAALAGLYEANEDWDRVAEVLRKAAQTGRGGPDQAEVHFRLARLNESHLNDEDGAIAELRKAVELNPGHVGANDSLVEYCRKRGDNDGLWEALMRQEMNLETDGEKVAKLLEIADLQSGPLGDAAGAVASLERAHEMDKSNKDVMLKLSDGYIAAGREDEAIPVIESLIEAETLGGKRRSKGAAVYHQRLAKAYLSRGDQDKSLEHLESAYKMDISNTEVLISLGKLHYDREDWDKAIKLFRALLLQRFDSSAGVDKADIYWYVGDISLKKGDARKAKGMFQRGLDENNGHEGCKDGLSKC